MPFIAPDQFAHKNRVLDEHCAVVGRDSKAIKRSINVGLAFTEESLQQQFGKISDFVRPGVLTGSEDEMMDAIGRYVDAGADQVNIALRAPFDLEALHRFSELLHLS